MSQPNKINFALCWHMHQPWYQQGLEGDYQLPWVYLHAIKDYSDMAAHLEAHPQMKVIVNFAPVLLEQLDDYGKQIEQWLLTGSRMTDPMLNLLAGVDAIPSDIEQRLQLLNDCQRANAEKMIDPYAGFRRLLQPVKELLAKAQQHEHYENFLVYLDDQYFVDVLVWYHLAWLGHSLKQHETAHRLIAQESAYSEEDRRELLILIHDCIAGLIPRYRELATRGQIELSMSPYGHPIIPLLNNIDNMKCAQPDAPRPACQRYPGGEQRAHWHLEKGIECFERYFGMRPRGIWLSEGAISEDAISLIEQYDFSWTASGEEVIKNSQKLMRQDTMKDASKRSLFHSYQVKDCKPKIFFRDDGLSDLIGFEYGRYNSVEAAEDLVNHLTNIADKLGDDASDYVVSIILDGENAWEYYPHNGHYFLDHLYSLLSEHEQIRCAHFSELADQLKSNKIHGLCAGSWVYGSFSTWIGQVDKNRAWELLANAKAVYDQVMASGVLDDETRERATRQLAIAEGSDWFWWFGDYNPSDSVRDFDLLYRAQLISLYQLLDQPVPDELEVPVSRGGGTAANAGTMVRNV